MCACLHGRLSVWFRGGSAVVLVGVKVHPVSSLTVFLACPRQVLCCNGEPLVSNSSTVTGTVFVSEALARDLTPDFLTADNAAVVGWQRLPSAVAELVAGAWGLAHCTRLSLRRRPCLARLLKPEVMSRCRTLLL